jgi:hypothetical protein
VKARAYIIAANVAFLLSMIAFTTAGNLRVLVVSPLGLAGPILAVIGAVLALRAIRAAD